MKRNKILLLAAALLALAAAAAMAPRPELTIDEQNAVFEAAAQTLAADPDFIATVSANVEQDIIDRLNAAGYYGVAGALSAGKETVESTESVETVETAEVAETVESASTEDGSVYHTVAADETIWTIAESCNTTAAEIQKLNGWTEDHVDVTVGEQILIPSAETAESAESAEPTPTATPLPETAADTEATEEAAAADASAAVETAGERVIDDAMDYWDGAVLQADGTYRGLHAKQVSAYAYTLGGDNGSEKEFKTEYTPNVRFNVDIVFENDGSVVWPARIEMRHVGNVGEYTGHAESVYIDRTYDPVKPGGKAAFTVSCYGSENLGWTTFYFKLYDADSGSVIEGGEGSFTYHAI